MIGAGVILGLILIAISFYAISIDKTLNALWETLRKKVHSSYYKIKTTLIERLIQYHNRTDLEEISDFNVRKSSAPIKFWHSVRYLLKLSVFFASAALFYALASAYFFMKIYKSLCIRPLLMYTVMIRRISMTELSYFMFENELLKTPQSLNALYPEFNIFTSPTLLYDQAYEYFKGANKVLALSESRSHLSNSFFTILFEKIDGFDNFLAFGTFSAYEYLCFESLNIIQNNAFDNIDTIKKFMSEKIQLETNVKSVFNLLESDTKAKIYSDLNSFIYFVVACCLFLILLYLVYYLPYLNSEKKILQRLMKNIAIVPLSNL